MLLLRHGQDLVVAHFHIAETDKDAVGHGAVPHLRVGKRPEAELVQIRPHIQKQTAAGDEIHLQNMAGQRLDGFNIFPVQMRTPFPEYIKNPRYSYGTVDMSG